MNEIITKQLILKKVQENHLQQIFEIWTDSEACKYMFDSHWSNVDELYVVLEEDDEYFCFAAFMPDGNDIVATCRISLEGDNGEWDLGYNVHKAFWGKGFATEMVQALLTFGRESLGVTTVVAFVAKANIASCKVLEKCGFEIVDESSFTKKGTDTVFPTYEYRLEIKNV